jgi:uncharacterized membrane protein
MRKLEYLLKDIPESERADALAYYNNYFDEAGVENEEQVIQELGSPEAVAQNILADMQEEQASYESSDYSSPEMENEESRSLSNVNTNNNSTKKEGMSSSTKILLIILLVFTFPIWIGVVAGLFGTVVGLLGGLFGIVVGLIATVIGFIVGGIGCMIGGVFTLFTSTLEGLVLVGSGALMAAIGILLALPCTWLVGVWIPKLVKIIVTWIKRLFHRNEGGNEI